MIISVKPTSLAMQFITLSVHLCLQHNACEAAHAAGERVSNRSSITAMLSPFPTLLTKED